MEELELPFLITYLQKNKKGKFYLRIEDTDLNRSTQEAIQTILKGLDWLGLDYDGSIIYQSQNIKTHQEIAHKLLEK